uniref:Uncharacterized protein n=1 Tax=Anopheles coluzzii TaxID=1518534 RepID=A0A8W7PXF9_ANOCL
MQMMQTSLAIALVALAVLTANQVSAAGPFAYDGEDSYGGDYGGEYGGEYGGDGYGGGYDGGYGGYGGWYGRKWNDVEMFLSMREKLILAATNALEFSQLAALNGFNSEALDFPYSFPGKLSLHVRELEKVPPFYKHEYLYKKNDVAGRRDDEQH